MDYRQLIVPLIIGITITVLTGLTPASIFLGIIIPAIFNILVSGLWIIPIVFLLVISFKGGFLVSLLLITIVIYIMEELFIERRYSIKALLRYNDLYVFLGCLGISLIVFFYTVMLVNALNRISTGVLSIIASLYSTREGITIIYFIILILALGLLEKTVMPWRTISPRERFVLKIFLRIASYMENTWVMFSHMILLLLLILTIYYGLPGLPGLILSYIGYRVTYGRKYSGLVSLAIYIIYLALTGLITGLTGFDEWLRAIVKNIDSSLMYSRG